MRAMKRANLIEYFGLDNDDASLITWSHAVNSRKMLDETLASDLMFIESDILIADDGETSQPIMAHPPNLTSDLTFNEWLSSCLPSVKGLKLDFKSPKALTPCLNRIKAVEKKVSILYFCLLSV